MCIRDRDQAVPDRVSIIENEEEEFSFGLPLKATISSDSQEVALANESNIPADQITISGRDHFSMFGGEKGSYQVGLLSLIHISRESRQSTASQRALRLWTVWG